MSSISTLFFKVTVIFRLNIFQHEKRNFVYENDYVVFFLMCLIRIIHNVVSRDFPNSELQDVLIIHWVSEFKCN